MNFKYDHQGQCVRCGRIGSVNINGFCSGKQVMETVTVERHGKQVEFPVYDCPMPWQERLKRLGITPKTNENKA